MTAAMEGASQLMKVQFSTMTPCVKGPQIPGVVAFCVCGMCATRKRVLCVVLARKESCRTTCPPARRQRAHSCRPHKEGVGNLVFLVSATAQLAVFKARLDVLNYLEIMEGEVAHVREGDARLAVAVGEQAVEVGGLGLAAPARKLLLWEGVGEVEVEVG